MKALLLFFYVYFLFKFSESKKCILRSDFDLKVDSISGRGESSKTHFLIFTSPEMIKVLNKLKVISTTFLIDTIIDVDCYIKNKTISKGHKHLIAVIDILGKVEYKSLKKIDVQSVLEELASVEKITDNYDFISKSIH